jgi:hypothetical protein
VLERNLMERTNHDRMFTAGSSERTLTDKSTANQTSR